ncbi:CBO0543 family protein [Paenibacillus alvei]
MMIFERWFLVIFSVVCLFVLFKFIPKNKKRDAWILFLFLQVITWPAGLIAVELGWIEYPTQLLPYANNYNKTSFSFEFFFFPIVAIMFSLYFPKRKYWYLVLLYYVGVSGFFTMFEVVLEKTTTLVTYHEWKWYWTFLTVIISLFINDLFYRWCKKGLIVVREHEN